MTDQPIALSFSRLSDFLECPLKFKSKYIDKDYPDDSDNPAFVKGNAIHKQVEDYILWLTGTESPEPTMSTYTIDFVPMLKALHKQSNGQLFPEKQIAVNHDWDRCGWFDPPTVVRYRAIIDLMAFLSKDHLLVGDVKSGKFREYEDSPTSQLRLTSAMCFNLFPSVEVITTAYFFVEHKRTVKVQFHRDQLDDLMKPFQKAYEVIQNETEFKYRKNKYCNWCKVPKGKCPVRS